MKTSGSDAAPSTRWLKSGSEDFFPPHLAQTLSEFNSFPASKWGFVTYDVNDSATGWQRAAEICSGLRAVAEASANLDGGAKVECALSPLSRERELKDWARDFPLRHEYPGPAGVESLLNTSLAKVMVLPDRDLVSLMRHDPFGSAPELMELVVGKNLISLSTKNGFLYDQAADRIVIPVHFKHDPMNTALTEAFMQAAETPCGQDESCHASLGYTGGFFASVENKQQIMSDLTSVSWLSILILGAFLGGVMLSGRVKLFSLLLPVAAGLSAACAAMIVLFGGIHGLVLSFGAGIVGLSVDYGLHAAFHKNRGVWRSNLFGLLTTCMVLAVVSFSSIPLMRQLMVFTLTGLIVSFAAIWLMFKLAGERLAVEPLRINLRSNKILGGVMLALALTGALGVFFKKHDLNLHRLNYMSERSFKITAWLHERMGRVMPLFMIRSENGGAAVLKAAHEERALARAGGIRLENVAAYLPPLAIQEKNLASWFASSCEPLASVPLSDAARQFFAPYLEDFSCNAVLPLRLDAPEHVPSYAAHLFSPKGWLSIWMPTGQDQEQKIRAAYPEVFSLLDVVESFPRLLLKELRWMLPLAVGLIFATLLICYRRLLPAAAALLPFFCGLGAVFCVMVALGLEINFIAIVSMMMLCGLSVDYGIFAVGRASAGGDQSPGTVSALIFAAISTSSGMIPLVFCEHPVLVSLGIPLCIGIPGALGGAFWGIPLVLGQSTTNRA